jgi:hypothetical protein
MQKAIFSPTIKTPYVGLSINQKINFKSFREHFDGQLILKRSMMDASFLDSLGFSVETEGAQPKSKGMYWH